MPDTRRIARNTLFLYFRQILIMAVSLYTVRVVLAVLGAEDYGIYNVVAGVVVLFGFVNSAMASGTQRFLNTSMGEGDEKKTEGVFTASLVLHLLIAVFVFALAETVGRWFIGGMLRFPVGREKAVMWCYQFIVATTIVNVIRIPFYATIIAYEQMSFFAVISTMECLLRLVIVFFIRFVPFDALVFYAFIGFFVALVSTVVYVLFCKRAYTVVCISAKADAALVKEIAKFSGWTLLTGCADMCKAQGTSMIFNVRYGVAINAAMGIGNQVSSALYQFVSNFQSAYTPQIVQSYAMGDKDAFRRLVVQSMKISFILFSAVVIPFSVNAERVISLWLKGIVPDYTLVFVYGMLLDSLVGTFVGPLASAMQGIGNIRIYQAVISVFIFLNLPATFMLVRLGFPPEYMLAVRVVLSLAALIWRLFYMKDALAIRPVAFFFSTVFLGLTIDSIALFSGSVVKNALNERSGTMAFLLSCVVSVSLVCAFSYVVLLSREERRAIARIIGARRGIV